MFKKSIVFVFVLVVIGILEVKACGSLGGGTDGQIFTNPTLTWMMSPPAAWTYPVSYAQINGQYFPGQPLTLIDANNQADGDMQGAVLEALASVNIPTQNVRVVSNYQPQMISNCVTVAPTGSPAGIPASTMTGNQFGVVEAGAVTRIATAGATIAVGDCAAKNYGTATTFIDNIVQGSLSIEGVTLSGLQLKQVVSLVENTLNFNYHVRFTTPITFA